MKTKNLIIACLCVLGMASCDDFLSPQPLNLITNENFWQGETDARAALNAAYAHLQSAYKVGYWYWFEARGDNVFGSTNGSYPYQGTTLNNITASYPCCNWNEWYKMVSVANYGIHFIPTMTGKLDEKKQSHFLAEAYFLRAFAYFNLYRIWGDVPLIVEPVLTKSDVVKPERTDKALVMAQIRADIEAADTLMDKAAESLYLFSPGALYALATDVAMWNKDYTAAVKYADALIELGKFAVEGVDFSLVCAKADTRDNIFTLKWDYSTNGANSILVTVNSSGGVMFPTKEIYEKWTAYEAEAGCADLRRLATIDSVRISGYGSRHIIRTPTQTVRTWKWSPGEFIQTQDYFYEMPITIYRFADILLLRAEALNKLGQTDEAIAQVNVIRRRAGLPDYTTVQFANADEIDDRILQERQFELYMEGKRWFDLMRTDRVEKVMNNFFTGYITTYGGSGYTLFEEGKDWQKFWPVHHDIINENPNIKQTGDY